jgi:hypothetical protein
LNLWKKIFVKGPCKHFLSNFEEKKDGFKKITSFINASTYEFFASISGIGYSIFSTKIKNGCTLLYKYLALNKLG